MLNMLKNFIQKNSNFSAFSALAFIVFFVYGKSLFFNFTGFDDIELLRVAGIKAGNKRITL